MTDGRRLMWTAVAGAAVAVTAATVMVAVAGGDDPKQPKPPPALAAPSETDDEQTVDVAVTEEASTAPSASPSPSRSPKAATQRPARPAELIAGMQGTIDWLVQERQLSRDAGRELGKRLREVEAGIADGDLNKAREKLREFTDRLGRLRKKDKISSAGYDALAAGAGQLAQAMRSR